MAFQGGLKVNGFFYRETMLDPMAVFALLFGSELFEDYVGHLTAASMTSSEMTDECEINEKLKASMFSNSVLLQQ